MDSYGLPRPRDVHPSSNLESQDGFNKLVAIAGDTSEHPSPGATQPQTITPETLQNRTLRRAKNLKALERVPFVDPTNDDSSEAGGPLAHRSAKVRRLVEALMEAHDGSTDDGSTNDGSTDESSTEEGSTDDDMSLAYREVKRLAVHPLVQALKRTRAIGWGNVGLLGSVRVLGIDLTDDVPRARLGWECPAVYPTSLTLACDDPQFTVKDGRWRTNCGRTLSTRIGVIRSIVAVVVRPSNGYPASFRLKRDKRLRCLTGRYGEDGTGNILLDAREMKAMIQLDWGDVGLVNFIWSPE